MIHGKGLVVVLPAYNAEQMLERTVAELPQEIVDEVLLVDDASQDHTSDLARSLGVRTLVHRQNLGYGGNQKTCYAAALNLGEWNLVIAITIAVLKALLIVLYFMHLRWSTWLVRLFAGAALFWLTILFVMTLQDYFSRYANMLPS